MWFLGSHPAGKLPLRVAVCETLSAASRNVAMLGSHMEHAQFSVSTWCLDEQIWPSASANDPTVILAGSYVILNTKNTHTTHKQPTRMRHQPTVISTSSSDSSWNDHFNIFQLGTEYRKYLRPPACHQRREVRHSARGWCLGLGWLIPCYRTHNVCTIYILIFN